MDRREYKNDVVPERFRQGNVVIAFWNQKNLKKKVEAKYHKKGFLKFKKNKKGSFSKIDIGRPIEYDEWIKLVKDGKIFFDSGMHNGNPRSYSQWRARESVWNEFVIKHS